MVQTSSQSTVNKIEMRLRGKGRGSIVFQQDYAGSEGAKRDSIYEYLKDVLPQNKTEEQQLRYVGRLLVELYEEKQIDRIGLRWILKDYNQSV